MWNYGYGMGGWMGGWFWMILATIGVVLLIVWAARSFSAPRSSQSTLRDDKSAQSTAVDALEMRFAKGEINEEEYRNMRRTLTGG